MISCAVTSTTVSVLKRLIAKIKQESFEDFLQSLDATEDSDYSLWKVSRACCKPANFIPPLIKPNNTGALTDKNEAETFAEHLENTFMPNNIDSDLDTTQEINQTTRTKYFSPS